MKEIYRCGWCGLPTNKEGEPLEVNPHEYLEKHKDAGVVHVNGLCCANDWYNELDRPITRDMMLDAGFDVD
jgi:hypothetical protein